MFHFQSTSLDGLDPTLIRNLTDHQGNNLLHIICAYGHLNMLPWVVRRFGNQVIEGVMNDENRKGITPPVAAIKVRNQSPIG